MSISAQQLAKGLAGAVKRLGPASDRLAAEGHEAQAKALKQWLARAGAEPKVPGWHGDLYRGGDAEVARVLGELRDSAAGSQELRAALRQAGSRQPRPAVAVRVAEAPQQPLRLAPAPAPAVSPASAPAAATSRPLPSDLRDLSPPAHEAAQAVRRVTTAPAQGLRVLGYRDALPLSDAFELSYVNAAGQQRYLQGAEVYEQGFSRVRLDGRPINRKALNADPELRRRVREVRAELEALKGIEPASNAGESRTFFDKLARFQQDLVAPEGSTTWVPVPARSGSVPVEAAADLSAGDLRDLAGRAQWIKDTYMEKWVPLHTTRDELVKGLDAKIVSLHAAAARLTERGQGKEAAALKAYADAMREGTRRMTYQRPLLEPTEVLEGLRARVDASPELREAIRMASAKPVTPKPVSWKERWFGMNQGGR
jgi:hypothetical protein